MKRADHLATDLLIRAIDDENTDTDRLALEAHLSACAECEARYHELAVLTVRVESMLAAVPVNPLPGMRERLEERMGKVNRAAVKAPLVSSPVGWGMAIAAGLALGLVFLPYHLNPGGVAAMPVVAAGTLEVEGETFVSLPYSNSDLPLGAPRVVRMQMPVSSLADAGLVFEPVSNEAARPDRWVLADVLLGADGEPLGVHVVANE